MLGVSEECAESRWISPIHAVLNESKEARLTINLRLVNKSIIRHHYPMAKVQGLLAEVSDSKYFSKLEMRKGYWQIELTNETCHITTFAVFRRLFRFRRVPFGIEGASDAMDLLMNLLLQGLDGVANLQDDVAVHGRTREEHDKSLFAVLDPMTKYGVTLNKKKCEFLKHKIEFLGHIVGDIGVSANPGKVEAITDMRRPTTSFNYTLSSVRLALAFYSNTPQIWHPFWNHYTSSTERTRSGRGIQNMKLPFEKQNPSFVVRPVLNFTEPKPSID